MQEFRVWLHHQDAAGYDIAELHTFSELGLAEAFRERAIRTAPAWAGPGATDCDVSPVIDFDTGLEVKRAAAIAAKEDGCQHIAQARALLGRRGRAADDAPSPERLAS